MTSNFLLFTLNRLTKPMVNSQHKVWSSRYKQVITLVVELSIRKECLWPFFIPPKFLFSHPNDGS